MGRPERNSGLQVKYSVRGRIILWKGALSPVCAIHRRSAAIEGSVLPYVLPV